MSPSRRSLHDTAALTENPPDSLALTCVIACIVKGVGNNIYKIKYPETSTASHAERSSSDQSQNQVSNHVTDTFTALAELSSRFRNKIWLKNGSYVVVDRGAFPERGNKLDGEIVNVVRQEKDWMKMPYWPIEFKKKKVEEDSDDDESNVGKMPPSPEESDDGGP